MYLFYTHNFADILGHFFARTLDIYFYIYAIVKTEKCWKPKAVKNCIISAQMILVNMMHIFYNTLLCLDIALTPVWSVIYFLSEFPNCRKNFLRKVLTLLCLCSNVKMELFSFPYFKSLFCCIWNKKMGWHRDQSRGDRKSEHPFYWWSFSPNFLGKLRRASTFT